MSKIHIEGPAEEILRQARSIEGIKGATNLSDKTKEFLIDKIITKKKPHCPKCNTVAFFPALAQTIEVQQSGHLGFWCSRDCGETGIETDLKWRP